MLKATNRMQIERSAARQLWHRSFELCTLPGSGILAFYGPNTAVGSDPTPEVPDS